MKDIKSKGYWTKERCHEEALKYNNRSDFNTYSKSAYGKAAKNGWLDEICSHITDLKKPNGYWTKEKCQEEALKYENKTDFQIKGSTAFSKAHKNGWLDEICSHITDLKKPNGYWTKEMCQEEASKYAKKVDFKKSGSGYVYALKNGWLDEICSHMISIKPMRYWTKEKCKVVSLQYTTRLAFRENENSAYSVCTKNNWLDEICSHMEEITKWNMDKCQEEALKYTRRVDFIKMSSGAYDAALRNGWLDYICQHMIGNGKHLWTKSNISTFIKTLEFELNNLDSIELLTIINSNNLAKKLKELGVLNDIISSPANSAKRSDLIKSVLTKIEEDENEEDVELEITDDDKLSVTELDDVLLEIESVNETEEVKNREVELKPTDVVKQLHTYANKMLTSSLDDENIEFLMKNQLKKLWNRVLNDNSIIDVIKKELGGEYFTKIKNWFFEEYENVQNIKIPNDYKFKTPNLMQRLITYRLLKEKRYGNWSGTGAGKTLSAILAGRVAEAKNTLIICNNSTVGGWVDSINEYFDNNNIFIKGKIDGVESTYTIINKYDFKFKPNQYNYLILNYETFQQHDSEYIITKLLDNNTIDYIILDEIQNIKQRDILKESSRRNIVNKLLSKSREINPDLLVLVMSATPIINNLTEPKKLIELLTGESHDDLETTENVLNGIEIYKALTRYGLRYIPKYNISENVEIIKVDGSHLVEDLLKVPKRDILGFEKVLIETKLNAIKQYIKKGTLVYTHYVDELGVVGLKMYIGSFIESLGFSVGYYTGSDKSGLNAFKNGKIDVLIGSSPVGTGVDGIQKVCNTLIPLILPWTASEFKQLLGRVIRQGSVFEKVNVYIPQVNIELEDNMNWSWDSKRYSIIEYKATLADLALDGIIPNGSISSKEKLMESARKELKEWYDRVNNGDIISIEREKLCIPLSPVVLEKQVKKLGDFSVMNQRWSISNSSTTHERLQTDSTEWYTYHTLYSKSRETWNEIPYIEIAKKIRRSDLIIGDFGCGENLLSKEISNKVFAIDHIAIDDSVIACDMKNVPLNDEEIDIAVFSLSLMGKNYDEYLKEAFRILKPMGRIFICEPLKKWNDRKLEECLENIGYEVYGTTKTDKFIYINGGK